jgi:hypothetical protein
VIFHKDGFCKDLKVKAIPIVVDQKIVGVFCIINDITEVNVADEADRRMKYQFSRTIHHGCYILS